ncbi:MAG: hypothetical protein WC508_05630 [Patescibacteria group bacterium]
MTETLITAGIALQLIGQKETILISIGSCKSLDVKAICLALNLLRLGAQVRLVVEAPKDEKISSAEEEIGNITKLIAEFNKGGEEICIKPDNKTITLDGKKTFQGWIFFDLSQKPGEH